MAKASNHLSAAERGKHRKEYLQQKVCYIIISTCDSWKGTILLISTQI